MLRLQILPGNDAIQSVSPFCLKAVYFMDVIGAEYELETCSPRGAPRGQLPCLHDGDLVIPDSAEIARHVMNSLGRRLSEPSGLDRAHAEAAIRVAEDSFYWVLVYAQFVEDIGWQHHGPDVAQVLPPWLRWALLGVVRRSSIERCAQAGTGKMPPEEVYRRGTADLETLAGLLGDKPFFGGNEPSLADLSVWAMLACFYSAEAHVSPAARAMLETQPGLRRYVARLEERRGGAGASPGAEPAATT